MRKIFFKATYDFLETKYGRKNVVSAYVHKDHLHFAFVPVVLDKKKNIEKVSAKECVTKGDLMSFHGELQKKIYDLRTLECALVQYTELAVERLRSQESECGAVSIYISTCKYYSENSDEQYSNGILVEFERMTSYTPNIVEAAKTALPHIFRTGYGYKTIMITLLNLLPAAFQGDLFTDPNENLKHRNFMNSLDKIIKRYGRGSLTLAKGFAQHGWEMKRKFLSLYWTTRYGDFPKIR